MNLTESAIILSVKENIFNLWPLFSTFELALSWTLSQKYLRIRNMNVCLIEFNEYLCIGQNNCRALLFNEISFKKGTNFPNPNCK